MKGPMKILKVSKKRTTKEPSKNDKRTKELPTKGLKNYQSTINE
ncbi:11318_t:CDS:1, partial [Funneliformis caledonium]